MNEQETIYLNQVETDSYIGAFECGRLIFSGLPQPLVWWKRYSYARKAVLNFDGLFYYYRGIQPKKEVVA